MLCQASCTPLRWANQRPGREHVVQRCHTVATALQHKQGEVLRMAVDGRKQPEQQLSTKEVSPIFTASSSNWLLEVNGRESESGRLRADARQEGA